MKRSLKRIALALMAVVTPCLAWAEVVYTNPLAGIDRSLELGGVTYQATAYTELTELEKNDTTGNFNDVIKAGGTYTQTHTFSMWVNPGTLPTEGEKLLWWVCGGQNSTAGGGHCGYAVKTTSDGKIRVGKATAGGAWQADVCTTDDNSEGYKETEAACLTSNTWAYVTIVISANNEGDTRQATPTVYVNGAAKTVTAGTFKTNLNGNGGGATFVQIVSDVKAAGVKVYNEAITAETVTADYADRTNLTVAPTAITWTGAAGDNLWSSGNNWSGGAAPTDTDSVEFNLTEDLTITIPEGGATVDFVTVKGAKLTLEGATLTTGDLVVNSELETPVACIEASNIVLDSSAVLTLDAGTAEIGRTMKISGGKVVKTGSALLTLYQSGDGVANAIFDGTTVQIAEGDLKLNIGPGDKDPWIKNTTFDFANGTSLLQYGWINGSGTVTLHAGDGVTATAFESNLAQQCILKKTGAGKVTANIFGTGPQGAPNNRLAEIQLNEGTLTLPRGDFTAKVTTAADTTLEFTGDATIGNAANNIVGLLKISGGTVTHNGADRGVNSFEIAEGAQLTSSAADGLNYNTTTTAKIDGTLYLKNRWTIFAGNAFYLSGTLASDDNDFGIYYCAFDFYNNANNDNNHTKLYVTGPDAQITGRWGAHDSSKTLDVVFNSNDAKLTISKAPTAYQHVTTMLGDDVTSGAIAVNVEVETEKLLTIAGGVALSGTGTWGGPVTLKDGATIDASAGKVTIGGDVTAEGTVNVTLPAEAAAGTEVLACNNADAVLEKLPSAPDGLKWVAEEGVIKLATAVVNVCMNPDTMDAYPSIQAAIDAGVTNIVLITDVTLEEPLELPAGVTLNSGVCTLTGTVVDSYDTPLVADENGIYTVPTYVAKASGTGLSEAGYTSLQDAVSAAAGAMGTVTLLDNVTISETITIDTTMSAIIDLGGKTVTGAETLGTLFHIKSGIVTVQNGAIAVTNVAFQVCDKVMDAAEEACDFTEYTWGYATLTLAEGLTVTSSADNCVLMYNGAVLSTAAVLTSSGEYATIQGTGLNANNATMINIIGGSVTSTNNHAIYHPQPGTLTITGGEISGVTGIEMRAGTLDMQGGSVTATGAYEAPDANNSGSTAKGAAIILSQHTTEEDITLEIATGVTLSATGTDAKKILVVNTTSKDPVTYDVSIAAGVVTADDIDLKIDTLEVTTTTDDSITLTEKVTTVPTETEGGTELSEEAQTIITTAAAGKNVTSVVVADEKNEKKVNEALALFDDIVDVNEDGVAKVDWDFGISDIKVNRNTDNTVSGVTVTAKVTKGDADQSPATFVNGVKVELYANGTPIATVTATGDTGAVDKVLFEIPATAEAFGAILGSELSVKATNDSQTTTNN